MEVKNKLLNFGVVIYQNDDWFKFSLDSVLLVNFVTLNYKCKNIMDFACGNAPIPMLLSFKTKAKIYGVEIQKCIYNLGIKSILENKMNDQIKLLNIDVKNVSNYFDSDSFDLVLCNPPYFKVGDKSFLNDNNVKRIARHEIYLTLDDLFESAFYLLKTGGRFAMVHRTERFVEILFKMKKINIEPKRIQFIHSKASKDSELFLIEGIKNGKSGLKILPNLIISNDDGSYKEYIRNMYGI